MTGVIELLPLNSPRSHPLFGCGAFQHLKVGFLIHSKDHFAALPEALDALVIPENFECALNGLLIPYGRFPIMKAMRLEVGFMQNVADCCVRDALYIALLHSRLSQSSVRPMCDVPTHRGGLTTRQSFNPLAFASGKKPVGGPHGSHRITLLTTPIDGSVHRPARGSKHVVQPAYQGVRHVVGYWHGLTVSERDELSVGVSGRRTIAPASKPYLLASTQPYRASGHAWLISFISWMRHQRYHRPFPSTRNSLQDIVYNPLARKPGALDKKGDVEGASPAPPPHPRQENALSA